MSVAAGANTQPADDLALLEEQPIRKAFRRLIPFLFVLFIISYLDRINIGFAALAMNKELNLTATMFGLANTIFYAGYAVCEIPSNLLLTRYGARKWIARILVTWGIASAATLFASSAASLYVLRLLVGVAEAGFLPGVLLYLTFWFPPTYRARATGMFLMAQPVTIAIGASVSGVILDHANGWLGLSGWRWMFLVEGLPAVLLGIITFFYLSDNPAKAKWLTDAEKAALQRRLEREQGSPVGSRAGGRGWREMFSRNVTILSLTYFCLVVGLNANAVWTPQIVRDVLETHSLSSVGLFTALPAVCALIAMPIWGARSDRKMERNWHFALPVLAAALGWFLLAILKMPELRMASLVLCSAGVFSGQVIFWTVPAQVLSPNARPVGIAWISTCGIVAASVSPLVFGFLRDLTNSWFASLIFVAVMLAVAAALFFLVPAHGNPASVPAHSPPRG